MKIEAQTKEEIAKAAAHGDMAAILGLIAINENESLRVRIEVLEAALREVLTNEIMTARKIARAALDKDAGTSQ
jgi:hypothetical protein